MRNQQRETLLPWRTRLAAVASAIALAALAACGDGEEGAADGPEAGTSPDDPLEADAVLDVYGWDLKVLEVDLDATAELDSANFFGAEPDHDQLATITLEGTYHGDDELNSLPNDILVGLWIDGVLYEECPTVAPGLHTNGAADDGETITNQWCLDIPSEGLDGALLWVRDVEKWVHQKAYYLEIA